MANRLKNKEELIGNKYNSWTIIDYSHTDKHGIIYYICKCECNIVKPVNKYALVNGESKSCGCSRNKRKNLIGKKFNKLTVIKFSHLDKNSNSVWLCKCECKNTKLILENSIIYGYTKSCGCSRKGMNIKNLVGQKFNKLTVIKFSHTKNYCSYWECICECNNKKVVGISNLRRDGKGVKSCGNCSINSGQFKNGEEHPNWNQDREQVKLNNTMSHKYRSLLSRVLGYTSKNKDKRTYEMLGYTQQELMQHLGIKELKDLKGKHIDHIFPVKAFIERGITDPKIINSLDNLQLLTIEENISKHAKYNKEDFEKYLKFKNIK